MYVKYVWVVAISPYVWCIEYENCVFISYCRVHSLSLSSVLHTCIAHVQNVTV
jgi:hypothetical protein